MGHRVVVFVLWLGECEGIRQPGTRKRQPHQTLLVRHVPACFGHYSYRSSLPD